MTLTPEQLAEHNAGLGGSDAYPATGDDPWKSQVELWLEKTNQKPPAPPRVVVDPRRDWGTRLEPLVRQWLAEELGETIHSVPTLRNPDYPWMVAHLDGVTQDPLGELDPLREREGIELKTCDKLAAQEFGEVGTDAIPIRYVLQVTHYMIVTELRRFHVGVLVGGNDPRHYVVDFDKDLAELLIARERAFWAHVESNIPPDPTTLADADYRWPTSRESRVKASEQILDAVTTLEKLRRDEARAGRAADEIEVQIKAFMGDSAILADQRGRRICTWRQQDRERFDYQTFQRDHADLAAQYRTTSSFRVFRLK